MLKANEDTPICCQASTASHFYGTLTKCFLSDLKSAYGNYQINNSLMKVAANSSRVGIPDAGELKFAFTLRMGDLEV